MPQEFDPYHKWLGISPKDQPPHHYRLLGIDLFEEDRDVIDAAANRVMSYLKDLATGDDAAHSQKLLNEVAQARLCLLNAERKAVYDDELRSKVAPRKPPLLRKQRDAASHHDAMPGPLPMSPPTRAAIPVVSVAGTEAPAAAGEVLPVALSVKRSERESAQLRAARDLWLVIGGVIMAVVAGALLVVGGLLWARRHWTASASSTDVVVPSGTRIPKMDSDGPAGADDQQNGLAGGDPEASTTVGGQHEGGPADNAITPPTPGTDGQSPDPGEALQNAKRAMLASANPQQAAQLAGEIIQKYAPDDREANDVYGRWACLQQDNWPEGLKCLAKGKDIELQRAAQLELAGATDPGQQVRVADAWYQAAESDGSRRDFLPRALHWYRTALAAADDDAAARAAARILEADPRDAAASLVQGKHLCLSSGDWQEGLRLLTQGTDFRLRNAASQDIARPTIASSRLRLADAWYAISQSDTALSDFFQRAGYWYELALPELDDANRARVLRLLAPHLDAAEKSQLLAMLEPRLTAEQTATARLLLGLAPTPRPTASWKPLAQGGELTECLTLEPLPLAQHQAVMTWLSRSIAAPLPGAGFQWKPAQAYQPDTGQRRSGQRGYTFAGPNLNGHFQVYKFEVRSDDDQRAELNASVGAGSGSYNTVAVSVDGRLLPKSRLMVPLNRGEHVIMVDVLHRGNSNPDYCWMRLELEGRKPILQKEVR